MLLQHHNSCICQWLRACFALHVCGGSFAQVSTGSRGDKQQPCNWRPHVCSCWSCGTACLKPCATLSFNCERPLQLQLHIQDAAKHITQAASFLQLMQRWHVCTSTSFWKTLSVCAAPFTLLQASILCNPAAHDKWFCNPAAAACYHYAAWHHLCFWRWQHSDLADDLAAVSMTI